MATKKTCKCPLYCPKCGRRRGRDADGHICRTRNCQYVLGFPGCTAGRQSIREPKASTIKMPSLPDQIRCFSIRCKGKRGEHVPEEDSAFCRQMYDQYPRWYREIEANVFKRTAPFGSQAAAHKTTLPDPPY